MKKTLILLALLTCTNGFALNFETIKLELGYSSYDNIERKPIEVSVKAESGDRFKLVGAIYPMTEDAETFIQSIDKSQLPVTCQAKGVAWRDETGTGVKYYKVYSLEACTK